MTQWTSTARSIDRRILALALPAFGALVAEPLFILTDTALVGHLGPSVLAGLGIASTILQTVLGLMVFLAYTTTPVVARRLGAGDRSGAIRAGIEGMWLSLVLGVALAVLGVPTAPLLTRAMAPDPLVAANAESYLLVSLAGLPAMLFVIAGTGLLRGLQDTRTPLIVAGIGFVANGALNALLIYGVGLGIAGSALGTVIAQWGMAFVFAGVALRASRRHAVRISPGFGLRDGSMSSAGWMILRTLLLRSSVLAVVWLGARLGVAELAALQVLFTIFNLAAFALDALAIAGQALVARGLGARDPVQVRAVTRRLSRWGLLFGCALAVLLAVLAPAVGGVFTSDPQVLDLLPIGLWTLAAGLPLAAYVFVWDGVLIGAGDARYLAVAGSVPLLIHLSLLAVVTWLGVEGQWPSGAGLVSVWAVFSFGYLGGRALTLWWRARGDAWLVVGSDKDQEASRRPS